MKKCATLNTKKSTMRSIGYVSTHEGVYLIVGGSEYQRVISLKHATSANFVLLFFDASNNTFYPTREDHWIDNCFIETAEEAELIIR